MYIAKFALFVYLFLIYCILFYFLLANMYIDIVGINAVIARNDKQL